MKGRFSSFLDRKKMVTNSFLGSGVSATAR